MAEKVAFLLGNGTNCFPCFVGIKGKKWELFFSVILSGLIWPLSSDTLNTGYQHLGSCPCLQGWCSFTVVACP